MESIYFDIDKNKQHIEIVNPLVNKLRLRDKYNMKIPFMFQKNFPKIKNKLIILLELLSGYIL